MRKTAPALATSTELTIGQWERFAQGWILDGEIRQLSPRTVEARRLVTEKLLWFARQREFSVCGTHELRAFLAYLSRGHEDGGGRWGNAQMKRAVRPATVHLYYRNLRTLFRWIVEEGALEASPMETLRPPVVRQDQIQPFTAEQITALLAAARRSRHPRRDEALLLFLLDTGARATEVCDLRMRDLDLTGRKARLLGKGNKQRTVYLGKNATKALWTHLREEPKEADEPVFTSDRGTRAGEALTRSGLLQLIERLGRAARIEACRCSPHTFRHTFAIEFLKAGGNVFTLKELLGHTSLTMTNRYVALAQADLEVQHRQFSPGDRVKRGQL